MIAKTYLSFKIAYLCFHYRTLLKKNEFRLCVQQRHTSRHPTPAHLIPIADRQARRFTRFFSAPAPCLLYSLVLSHLAGQDAQIYLWVQSKDPFQVHAYLKYQEQIYSTAQGVDLKNSILLDNKSCLT